jgi:hypothetical protein
MADVRNRNAVSANLLPFGESSMRLLRRAASVVITTALVGCSGKQPLDTQEEAKRIAFCATVIDIVKPDDKTCGPYLEKARQELQRQQATAAAVEAAKPKPADLNGWRQSDYPGIYWRWCDPPDCGTNKVIGDNAYVLAQVWCKTRACGDIYARVNFISDSDVVVGWTNDTGYGDNGQKVQLTFQSSDSGWSKVRLTELNIRG